MKAQSATSQEFRQKEQDVIGFFGSHGIVGLQIIVVLQYLGRGISGSDLAMYTDNNMNVITRETRKLEIMSVISREHCRAPWRLSGDYQQLPLCSFLIGGNMPNNPPALASESEEMDPNVIENNRVDPDLPVDNYTMPVDNSAGTVDNYENGVSEVSISLIPNRNSPPLLNQDATNPTQDDDAVSRKLIPTSYTGAGAKSVVVVSSSSLDLEKTTTTKNKTREDAAFRRELLGRCGVGGRTLTTLVRDGPETAVILAWTWYVLTQSNLTSPGGFVVTQLRGQHSPQPSLLALAEAWLGLGIQDRAALYWLARPLDGLGLRAGDSGRLAYLVDDVPGLCDLTPLVLGVYLDLLAALPDEVRRMSVVGAHPRTGVSYCPPHRGGDP